MTTRQGADELKLTLGENLGLGIKANPQADLAPLNRFNNRE